MINLEYIIENEFYVVCPFLETRKFIEYVKCRDFYINETWLETLERLGLFYPFFRVKKPIVTQKIISTGQNRVDILGILKDGETWDGDTNQYYSPLSQTQDFLSSWFHEGILWDPSVKEFTPWDDFRDEHRTRYIENYYSIFQIINYSDICDALNFNLDPDFFENDKGNPTDKFGKLEKVLCLRLQKLKENKTKERNAHFLLQVLSNKYFPYTQTDKRTVSFRIPSVHLLRRWDYYEYCNTWNPHRILEETGLNVDQIRQFQIQAAYEAKKIDPLEKWYDLIQFISLNKKKKLKGSALFAQDLYAAEYMLRLFYQDLTDEKLSQPNETFSFKRKDFYGEGVTEDTLLFLELLTNEYHLNPKPNLILIVEGEGEAEQVPRLVNELFNTSLSHLGIILYPIKGIANFEGSKKNDPYGAFEKLIDFNSNRQTIVFVILDNERRIETIKNKLIKKPSSFREKESVTKEELFRLWDKNIEFDNFTDDEIVRCLNKICKDGIRFEKEEISECRKAFSRSEGNHLAKLYQKKCNYQLPKMELLRSLTDLIIENKESEFDSGGNHKRKLVKIISDVIELASINHQPVTLEIKQKNQTIGFFGNTLPDDKEIK